jgi:hypothetical protein
VSEALTFDPGAAAHVRMLDNAEEAELIGPAFVAPVTALLAAGAGAGPSPGLRPCHWPRASSR